MILTAFRTTKQSQERLEGDLNPDLCDAGPVLHQLSYKTNWKLVVVWVNDKPIDDGLRSSTDEGSRSKFIIHRFIINPHNNQLPVGLIF